MGSFAMLTLYEKPSDPHDTCKTGTAHVASTTQQTQHNMQQHGCSIVTGLVQVEEGHDLFRVLCFRACLQQQPTVMEGKADHLLHFADDLTVAVPAHTP